MYTLIEKLGLQIALRREFIPFFVAFSVAEFFYKFHSFALECLAFLITWYVLSFIQQSVLGKDR